MKVRVRLLFLLGLFFCEALYKRLSLQSGDPSCPAHWENTLRRTPAVLLCYLERKRALQSAGASMPADPHGSLRPSVCLNSDPCDGHDSAVCLAISLQILLPFAADALL